MIQIQDDSVNQSVTPSPISVASQAQSPLQSNQSAIDDVRSDKTAEIDQLLAELDKLSKNLEEKPAVAATETVAESKPVVNPIAESKDESVFSFPDSGDSEDSKEKFDFDSFLTDLEKKIDEESQKHQAAEDVSKQTINEPVSDMVSDVQDAEKSSEDFRKTRPSLDMQADDSSDEPATVENEKSDESDSEELKAQNIFDMLGLTNISDEDKNQFLDELESMIWDDFIVHDLELLLTSEEYVSARKILDDGAKADDEKKEALITYLEALVPDLDEVLYEKALELKSEMMGERLNKMKEGAPEAMMAKIKEAEGLISQNLWKSASSLLNQLS